MDSFYVRANLPNAAFTRSLHLTPIEPSTIAPVSKPTFDSTSTKPKTKSIDSRKPHITWGIEPQRSLQNPECSRTYETFPVLLDGFKIPIARLEFNQYVPYYAPRTKRKARRAAGWVKTQLCKGINGSMNFVQSVGQAVGNGLESVRNVVTVEAFMFFSCLCSENPTGNNDESEQAAEEHHERQPLFERLSEYSDDSDELDFEFQGQYLY